MGDDRKSDMSRVHLSDIIQLCCLGGLTGTTEISDSSFSGSIYLTGGRIVHAVAESASEKVEGEHAFYKLVNSVGGDLEFTEGPHTSQQTIHKEYEYLLLEAARIRDTGGRDSADNQEVPPSLMKLRVERIPVPMPVVPAKPKEAPPPVIDTNITGNIEIEGMHEECMIDRLGPEECWLRSLAVLQEGDRFFLDIELKPGLVKARVQAEVDTTTQDSLAVHVRFLSMDTQTQNMLNTFLRSK